MQVIIATPADGVYSGSPVSQSGTRTAAAVRDAFVTTASRVSIQESCASLDCMSGSLGDVEAYAVVPTILHWEERATEWSGIPDQVRVQLDVYDLRSRELLSSYVIRGFGQQWSYGGDHPQDLLPAPLTEHVETLYLGGDE
jgi:hypothetical protein